MADSLSLREAAAELGVHYMTAYRYVRIGQLPATKEGAEWRVRRKDLALVGREAKPARRSKADWADRFYSRLVEGDENGAWKVVESALASAHEPTAVYLEIVAPALRRIGKEWEDGELDIATEHRATAIALRLVGRIGAIMRPRGRRKGTVVLGAPAGERHGLPLAMVADMFRAAGYDVTDLGADVPDESFLMAAQSADRLKAVGVGVSNDGSLPGARRLIKLLREALPAGTRIVTGGAAVESAQAVGADFHAADGVAAVEFVGAPVAS
jgi:excisionase family DNA binding protein